MEDELICVVQLLVCGLVARYLKWRKRIKIAKEQTKTSIGQTRNIGTVAEEDPRCKFSELWYLIVMLNFVKKDATLS